MKFAAIGLLVCCMIVVAAGCDNDDDDDITQTQITAQNATVIEVARAALLENVTEAEFLQAAETLQQNFLKKQPGFQRRILTKNANGVWTALVFWDSMAAAQAAAAVAMQDSSVVAFASKFQQETFSMEWVTTVKEWTK